MPEEGSERHKSAHLHPFMHSGGSSAKTCWRQRGIDPGHCLATTMLATNRKAEAEGAYFEVRLG